MERSLYSYGQQFHQCQQNEQPPFTLTHWTQKGDNYIWRWRSRSWLGTGTKMWRG